MPYFSYILNETERTKYLSNEDDINPIPLLLVWCHIWICDSREMICLSRIGIEMVLQLYCSCLECTKQILCLGLCKILQWDQALLSHKKLALTSMPLLLQALLHRKTTFQHSYFIFVILIQTGWIVQWAKPSSVCRISCCIGFGFICLIYIFNTGLQNTSDFAIDKNMLQISTFAFLHMWYTLVEWDVDKACFEAHKREALRLTNCWEHKRNMATIMTYTIFWYLSCNLSYIFFRCTTF